MTVMKFPACAIHFSASRSRRVLVLGIAWAIAIATISVRADSIFVGNLERKNATIKELKGDMLVFDFNGRTTEQQAAKISRLVVPSETALTAAEEAYATQRWDDAVDNYQKAQKSAKQWVKDWSGMRLIDAAAKSGRFDAAASAYIAVLLKNPAVAAPLKPAMPDARSTFLDSAIADTNSALKDSKLTVEQRRALLGFLIELAQAKKDSTAEDAAYEQLAKLPGADVNDPTAKRVLARRKLSLATRALDAKNYTQAITEIESAKAMFVDPSQQAEALFILAEAQAAQAGTDSTRLKDAALAYMRVVALAKNESSHPRVVESLLKTAAILEKIGDTQSAQQLYAQIVSQYPDDPLTVRARNSLERMKQG
jgi:TolA-binding protein